MHALVAQTQQVIDRGPSADRLIDVDGRDAGGHRRPQHHRRHPQLQLSAAGHLARCENDDDGRVHRELAATASRGSHRCQGRAVAVLSSGRYDGLKGKPAANLVQTVVVDADGLEGAVLHGPGCRVGAIVQFLHRGLHPLALLVRDVPLALRDAGDRLG